jgi:hypothetical protein
MTSANKQAARQLVEQYFPPSFKRGAPRVRLEKGKCIFWTLQIMGKQLV